MNIIEAIEKIDDIEIEKYEEAFFKGCDEGAVPLLIFYYYKNKEYYNILAIKDKTKNPVGKLYEILTLIELSYIDYAKEVFNENREKVIGLYFNSKIKNKKIKYDILLLAIYFKDGSLINEIKADSEKSFLENVYLMLFNFPLCTEESLRNSLMDKKYRVIHNKIIDILIEHFNVAYEKLREKVGLKQGEYEKRDIKLVKQNISLNRLKDNFIEIVEYDSRYPMSMISVKINEEIIILDCGTFITKDGVEYCIDFENFFRENQIDIKNIKGVLISHAHLDHYGGIFDLINKYNLQVYMNVDTAYLIEEVRKEKLNKNVNIVKDDFLELGNFKIKMIENGHIFGSRAFLIGYLDKRIFYTGDYCLNNQISIKGLDINKLPKIDYLILEGTNAYKNYSFSFLDTLKIIKRIVKYSLKFNTQVIITAPSLGITQEIVSLLKTDDSDFGNCKILVDGVGAKYTRFYLNNSLGYDIDRNIHLESVYDVLDNINIYDVIILGNGAYRKNSGLNKYIKCIEKVDYEYSLIKIGGVSLENEYKNIKGLDGINLNIFNIFLSNHASYSQLVTTINKLGVKGILMVHLPKN